MNLSTYFIYIYIHVYIILLYLITINLHIPKKLSIVFRLLTLYPANITLYYIMVFYKAIVLYVNIDVYSFVYIIHCDISHYSVNHLPLLVLILSASIREIVKSVRY